MFCGYASSAFSGLEFNDGGNHTIDYVVDDFYTSIDNNNEQSTPENHTSVELVDGGQIRRIDTYSYGHFVINGGIVNYSILARDNSHIVINAGTFTSTFDRHSYSNALLEVYGGSLSSNWFASYGGEIKIYGYDYTVIAGPMDGFGEIQYTFNGTLANGNVVNDL